MPLCVEHNFKRLIAVCIFTVLEIHPVPANVTAVFQGSLKILIRVEREADISCHCAIEAGEWWWWGGWGIKEKRKEDNFLIYNFLVRNGYHVLRDSSSVF